ncbi:MAG TPA: hypothetical protein VEX62_04595 [Candidatus Limnocylindrales bacterium]|jgi:hypothetical protein|nr:hypothetical protein [Candidatus Limnocylindrales bacterium]
MDLERLLPLLIGAVFGALGWLVVGMYLSRRQNERQARSSARAVYFELVMNQIDIDVAASHGVYGTLRRGAFDRLLPELATWLEPDELETIVRAYMSHAGYDQAQRDEALPAAVKGVLLKRVLAEHEAASGVLRRRAFSAKEAARLTTTGAAARSEATVSAPAPTTGGRNG